MVCDLEPVDVVEASLDIAALFPGRTFIAQLWPNLFVVIKACHQIAAYLLKEGTFLNALEQGNPVLLAVNLGVWLCVACTCRCVELGYPVCQQLA